MADFLDTPLTRLKADYDARLLAKDVLIADLQMRTETAQENLAKVKGINQMLRLLLADMATGVDVMRQQIDIMGQNIAELRGKLPDIED
jgi:uncharacterized membrane protein